MESTEIKTIDDAFNVFRILMSSEDLCTENQKLLSNLGYIIDACALGIVINFFNNYPELASNGKLWKSNLFTIRTFALVSAEIIKYLNDNEYIDKDSFDKPNNLGDVLILRNKIHQFRNNDFKKNISKIDLSMGRSRNSLTPRLDVCLEYLSNKDGKSLFGTNIYQFHFSEAKDQLTVDLMQRIIRAVEKQSLFSQSDFEIQRSKVSPNYKWEVYCYTDILKHTLLQNEKVIDRVLLAFDDLCCVLEFFTYTILNDTYLIQAPFLLFFLCKIVAVVLDETFDNFTKYIDRSPDDNDGFILKEIEIGIDDDFIASCQKLRNNLHYQQQTTMIIETPEKLYCLLQTQLATVELLVNRIRTALNISPSKKRLILYRFLRWVQMPNELK